MELKTKYTTQDLLEILRVLRSDKGCPWDRVQTHESIKKSMIEETYEAIDALDNGDDSAFSNELGDVLLQVAFHATIAKERGAFDFDDVLREVCTKLITRHTHVFGEDKAASVEDALGTWEKNKKKENELKTKTQILNDIPKGLPALMRTEKIQKKAEAFGVEKEDINKKAGDIKDILNNLMLEKEDSKIREEFGKLLFNAVSIGRDLGLSAEVELADFTNNFIKDFEEEEANQ